MRRFVRDVRFSRLLLIAAMACHRGSADDVAFVREFVNLLKPAMSAHLAHAEQVRAAVATRK